MADPTRAVLLMAYGTPESPDDVEEYFTNIRHGHKPPAPAVENLRRRYERVGGGTPLRHISESVRTRLEQALAERGTPARVYLGMKYWHPFIKEAVREMSNDGVTDAVAIALAPHYSKMSIGSYEKALREAELDLKAPFATRVVERWHTRPEFTAMMTGLVNDALGKFEASERDALAVVFTAHSLPIKIREWNDPYERELSDSAANVAKEAGLDRWHFAWQSAGGTSEPWIGPDILEYLEELQAQGARAVLQVPIGFVAEHLEILYDIDIEAVEKARSLGMHLERTALPNDSAALIDTLVSVVAEASDQVSAVGP
ncbi:MAG TPA: ferrochelatase [Gemmatimonadaceae bacterium]|nr:ferrochelatase [Gemmatimonadaceae bacterium]